MTAALLDLYADCQPRIECRSWGWIVTPIETVRITVVYPSSTSKRLSAERPKIDRRDYARHAA